MSSRQEQRQQNSPHGSCLVEGAVKPQAKPGAPSSCPAQKEANTGKEDQTLMEQVLERQRMQAALRRVRENKGAPGIDGMTVDELPEYLKKHWPAIKEELLAGTYKPKPVKQVEIPKPSGGVRLLGIPTVLDRLIQQALLDAMTPIFNPDFSDNSYGFRPGRNAHQAVEKARGYIGEGNGWVVDLDLEKFFDRVNHDILMSRVARKVKDKRVLKLIRAYLNAGIMLNGCVVRTEEGTPQGGPLSPLLANILLDDLDKELEARGHRFVRYADDCNIYVRSQRAGERVMESVREYLEKRLKLRINQAKSAVDSPVNRQFLGFSFTSVWDPLSRLATKTKNRFKEKIRELTRRSRSMSQEERIKRLNRYLRGWCEYFRPAAMKAWVGEMDGWIRRRLRTCLLKQWKKSGTKRRKLVGLGIESDWARCISSSRKGYWRLSNTPQLNKALGSAYWRDQGLLSLSELYRKPCYAT